MTREKVNYEVTCGDGDAITSATESEKQIPETEARTHRAGYRARLRQRVLLDDGQE